MRPFHQATWPTHPLRKPNVESSPLWVQIHLHVIPITLCPIVISVPNVYTVQTVSLLKCSGKQHFLSCKKDPYLIWNFKYVHIVNIAHSDHHFSRDKTDFIFYLNYFVYIIIFMSVSFKPDSMADWALFRVWISTRIQETIRIEMCTCILAFQRIWVDLHGKYYTRFITCENMSYKMFIWGCNIFFVCSQRRLWITENLLILTTI